MSSILSVFQMVLVYAIPILFAITLHEVAHGWVASKLGDQTAKMMGRLTLNPLKHIDLIGTVLVPILLLLLGGFIFGWAKPVPVSWSNLRHPRRDSALVASAGPCSNLVMALLWAFIAKAGLWLGTDALAMMGQVGIGINLILLVLNFIPIPPLDGSRVVASLLPLKAARAYNSLEPYGFLILLALLAFGVLGIVLKPAVVVLRSVIAGVFGI